MDPGVYCYEPVRMSEERLSAVGAFDAWQLEAELEKIAVYL